MVNSRWHSNPLVWLPLFLGLLLIDCPRGAAQTAPLQPLIIPDPPAAGVLSPPVTLESATTDSHRRREWATPASACRTSRYGNAGRTCRWCVPSSNAAIGQRNGHSEAKRQPPVGASPCQRRIAPRAQRHTHQALSADICRRIASGTVIEPAGHGGMRIANANQYARSSSSPKSKKKNRWRTRIYCSSASRMGKPV